MWRTIYHEFRRWAKTSTALTAVHKRTEITVETEWISIIRKSRATRGRRAEFGREVDRVNRKDEGAIARTDGPMTSARRAQERQPGPSGSRE